MRLTDDQMASTPMFDAPDNKHCLAGKRMEWIGDSRLERQTPGTVNSPLNRGAHTSPASDVSGDEGWACSIDGNEPARSPAGEGPVMHPFLSATAHVAEEEHAADDPGAVRGLRRLLGSAAQGGLRAEDYFSERTEALKRGPVLSTEYGSSY
jgi:hypothetical protein